MTTRKRNRSYKVNSRQINVNPRNCADLLGYYFLSLFFQALWFLSAIPNIDDIDRFVFNDINCLVMAVYHKRPERFGFIFE